MLGVGEDNFFHFERFWAEEDHLLILSDLAIEWIARCEVAGLLDLGGEREVTCHFLGDWAIEWVV